MENAELFKYQALHPPGRAIRLLKLLPGQFSDDICISMLHREHYGEKLTPYECLSYTWGSSAQAEDRVYILNELPSNEHAGDSLRFMPVRHNLFIALQHLRLRNSARVLWVDALCIDQQNVTEKGREVARMGHIYSNAVQVIVWLGLEDEDTPLAQDMIKRLSAGVVLSQDHRTCLVIPESEAKLIELRSSESRFTLQHWTALRNILQRPWFRRLWIRQEVQMASKVELRCGHREIDWEDMEKVSIFLEQYGPRALISGDDILFCRSLFPYVGSDRYVPVIDKQIFNVVLLVFVT